MRRNTRTEPRSARVSDTTLATEREVLDSCIRANTARPVYSAIRNAFIEQFSLLYVTLMDKGKPISETVPPDLAELDKACTKLAGLLFSRSNIWAVRDWRNPPILKFLFRCLKRSKTGRPLTRLGVAAQAKELKLAEPERWTWSKLVSKFCDCGKEHTIRCQGNLRREVLHLEKLLKSCGQPIEAREKGRKVLPMR
jgi:hypothetical protein